MLQASDKVFRCIKNGQPVRYSPRGKTPLQVLISRAKRYPSKTAIVAYEAPKLRRSEINYRQLLDAVLALTCAFCSLQDRVQGATVAILTGQAAQTLELLLAAVTSGLNVSVLDPQAADWQQQLRLWRQHRWAAAVIPGIDHCSGKYLDRLKIFLDGRPDINVWSVGRHPWSKIDLSQQAGKSFAEVQNCTPELESPALVALVESDEDQPDLACPAVVFTARALLANIEAVTSYLKLTAESRLYLPLPLTQMAALVPALASLLAAGRLVISDRFSFSSFCRISSKESVDKVQIRPEMLDGLLAHDEQFQALHVIARAIRYLIVNGRGLCSTTAMRFIDTCGIAVIRCFGPEVCGEFALGMPLDLPASEYERLLPGPVCGVELDYCNVTIAGEDEDLTTSLLPANLTMDRQGRILVRGPVLASGYVNADPLQDRRFRNGWYDTGLLGRLRRLGSRQYVAVYGRESQSLTIQGKRIWPQYLEAALKETFAFLKDCFVMGVTDSLQRQQLLAVTVLPDNLSSEKKNRLLAQMRARLSAGTVKGLGDQPCPNHLIAMAQSQVPRNLVGKVHRGKLRRMISNRFGKGVVA